MKAQSAPIFIVGYGRSGTEMVRFSLNAHPDIAITPEYRDFPLYNLERLTETIWATGMVPDVVTTSEQLAAYLKAEIPRNPGDVLDAYGNAWAEKEGKPDARWGDKYTANWQYMNTLATWYPRSQFIHLVRDPRDVVSSVIQHFPRNVVLNPTLFPPHLNLAWRWRKSLRSVRRAGEAIGPDRYLRLRYEDIVADPPAHVRQLCSFLRIEFQESMLSTHRDIQKGISQVPSKSHRELGKPMGTGRIGRHGSNLTETAAGDIAALCVHEMKEFGYDSTQENASPIQRARLGFYSAGFELGWAGVRWGRRLRGRL